MFIDGDYNKDFLKHFKHLKSLKMEDYFIPYEPIFRALERDKQLEELLNGED